LDVSLVLTVIGTDRPGLVEALSETIVRHEGNWLESRMSRMAGQFAGILRVSVPQPRAERLAEALRRLEARGLRIVVEQSVAEDSERALRTLALELVGNDRPGIVREITQALAKSNVNVDELETERSPAPMSNEPLFTARATLRAPLELDIEKLRETLEAIAHDLMVDLSLVDFDETST